MTINDVHKYTVDKLAENWQKDAGHLFIKEFLTELKESKKTFSKRLLICIGIDLKHYLSEFGANIEFDCLVLNYQKVILNIQFITYPKSYSGKIVHPHLKFALAVLKFGIFKCKPEISTVDKANYVRIINFDGFYDYLLPDNKDVNLTIPYDMEKRRGWKRFYEDFTLFGEHKEINIATLSSGTGWVFATDKTELKKFLDAKNIYTVLDRIGYYAGRLPKNKDRNKYIYIQYPEIFNEEMTQPTALIGDWGRSNYTTKGNEFFLSYVKNSKWGKTFPVSGSRPSHDGIKERAHFKFDIVSRKHYQFKVEDLDELTTKVAKAKNSAVIDEALIRFQKA